MKKVYRASGQPELLAIIAVIGILVALLLPALEAARKANPAAAHKVDTVFALFCYAFAFWILASIGEESANLIGLGRQQWRRRKLLFGLRQGFVERALYFAFGLLFATILLACFGIRPANDLLETSFWYPLDMILMTTFLISSHVTYRAVRRWNNVKHHANDFCSLFHPAVLALRLEASRRIQAMEAERERPPV